MVAETEGRLRADAIRNRERVLQAASEVFVAHGPDAPLDAIARRAGVGIATVYRRFPDRTSLVRAVAVDIFTHLRAELEMARDEEPTAFAALRRFMHAALDLRIGAIMPSLVRRVVIDDDLETHRAAAAEEVQAVIDRAKAEGELRGDVEFGDVMLANARFSRPLPASLLDTEQDAAVGHRQLEIYLAGLRAVDAGELPGHAFTPADFDELARRMSAASESDD